MNNTGIKYVRIMKKKCILKRTNLNSRYKQCLKYSVPMFLE